MDSSRTHITRRGFLATVASAAVLAGLAPTFALADPSSEELQAQLDEARAQLDQMGNTLASMQAELADQTYALETTRSDIFDIETQISDTQAQLEEAKGVLAARMHDSYKDGSGSALDLILGSTSVEELVSRVYYLDKLGEADAETIATVNALAAQLSQQRADLEAQQAEQEAQIEQSTASLAEYQSQVSSVQSYLQSLDTQVQEALEREAAEAAAQQQAQSGMANAIVTIQGPDAVPSTPSSDAPATSTPDTGQSSDSGQTTVEEPDTTPSGSGVAHPEVVSAAASLIGMPYKQWWTGVNYGPGASGYDCCGLVATAYHLCGYSYPAYQAPVSSIVATLKARGNWKSCNMSNYQSVLAVGDVLVESMGHVAIYAGGNQMIEAPNVGLYVRYATVRGVIGGGFGG